MLAAKKPPPRAGVSPRPTAFSADPLSLSMWRAGCGGSRTSGSEGGPGKPTGREPGRAPRFDPYHENAQGLTGLADVSKHRRIRAALNPCGQTEMAREAQPFMAEPLSRQTRAPSGSSLLLDDYSYRSPASASGPQRKTSGVWENASRTD